MCMVLVSFNFLIRDLEENNIWRIILGEFQDCPEIHGINEESPRGVLDMDIFCRQKITCQNIL